MLTNSPTQNVPLHTLLYARCLLSVTHGSHPDLAAVPIFVSHNSQLRLEDTVLDDPNFSPCSYCLVTIHLPAWTELPRSSQRDKPLLSEARTICWASGQSALWASLAGDMAAELCLTVASFRILLSARAGLPAQDVSPAGQLAPRPSSHPREHLGEGPARQSNNFLRRGHTLLMAPKTVLGSRWTTISVIMYYFSLFHFGGR